MADCLFCRIRDGQIPAKMIHEDEHCFAFRDINPQAPTHLLVVPRRHVATLSWHDRWLKCRGRAENADPLYQLLE